MTIEPSITILHLSDMQFGRHHRFGRLGLGGADERFDTLLQRVHDDLAELERSHALRPDIIALTGDLAEWGLKSEFAAVQQFAEGLAARLGLGRERVLVIPGNHDINRKKCSGYFDDREGDGETPAPPYWPKWKPFVEFFGELYNGVDGYRFTELEPWTLFELPELRVVVAGLNSTMRESHRDADHYGWLGEGQLRWFAERLRPYAAKGWLRVGLVHHNPVRGATDDDENLRDAGDLREHLGEHLNLLLHGHTHLGRDETLGGVPVLSTGSAGVKSEQRPEEVPNQYQVVRVTQDAITCFARQYTVQRKRWVGDTRVSRRGDAWSYERKHALVQVHATFPAREPSQPRAPAGADDIDEDDAYRPFAVSRPPAPDDLLRQVMEVCEIRCETQRPRIERVHHRGPWGDYARVTDPERGTYLLGAREGELTATQLDLWIKDVHEPFRSRGATRGATSQLIVASPERLPEALRQRAQERGVQIERLVDYQRILDVGGYLEDLRMRLDADPVYPRERYIEQRVKAWHPVSAESREVHGAAGWITDRLREPEGSFMLVLAPAGAGKTFLLREVARRLASCQEVVTPLLIELRRLESAHDVPELAAWHFSQRRLSFPFRAFERELREGRIALLFDGFDELALRVKSSAVPAHFDRILHAARDQARIVVTSRAEHFLSRGAVEELMVQSSTSITSLGGALQTVARRQILALKGFQREDVERYLVTALGEARGNERMQRLSAVHDLVGLATNPRMLGFLVDIPDKELAQAEKLKGNLTSAALYRIVIEDSWLTLEHRRLNPPGAPPGPTIGALRDAATRLALHLWRNTSRAIDPSELTAHVGDVLTRLCDGEVERATHTLRARTLLTRDDAGRVSFIHQTVLEWLVASALAREIEADGHSLHLEIGRINDFMIDILRELLGEDRLGRWVDAALELPGSRLGENVRDVLKFLGRKAKRCADLRGQDLRGQDLGGQELRGALLDDADLTGIRLVGRDLSRASLKCARLAYADLSDATLAHVDLAGADLSFARLHRADLGDARLADAVLLGTSFLGARGALPAGVLGEPRRGGGCDHATLPGLSPCSAVACSPRGRVIASGHHNGGVRLWDLAYGKLLRVLRGHTAGVLSLAWRPDCALLASASVDGTVRVWSAVDGTEVRALGSDSGVVRSVCFSPDGRVLAGGCDDGHVRLWSVDGVGEPRLLEARAHIVASVAFSPDGTMLASGSFDRKVRIWRLDGRGEPVELRGHARAVVGVAWSPDGASLASASHDQTVRLWRASDGKELRVIEGHRDSVTGVAWSPDGNTLATSSHDETLRLWKIVDGQEYRRFNEHSASVRSVAWSADGAALASGSYDGTVRVWRAYDGAPAFTLDGAANVVHTEIAWSPDGTAFAALAGPSGRIWSVAGGHALRRCRHPRRVQCTAWSPDSATLASADAKFVFLWRGDDDDDPRVLSGHAADVTALAWSPDGTTLASASVDRTVRVWRAKDGEELHVLEHGPAQTRATRRQSGDYMAAGTRCAVTSVAWSPDWGTRLATGAEDGVVRVWSADEIGPSALRGHAGPITSVAWSPDGTRLASASRDHSVRLWLGEAPLRVLVGHTAAVEKLAWSPDGATLASVSEDETLRLWRVGSGVELQRIAVDPGASLLWSRDGRHLAVHGSGGEIRLWEVASGRCVETLSMLTTRSGGTAIVRADGRYRVYGDVAGDLWHAVGLHRYELGELDDAVPGGLRMPVSELLFVVGLRDAAD